MRGRVPVSEFERMRAPFMAGDFPFPVKYGYATVGRVESGGDASRGQARSSRSIRTRPSSTFLRAPPWRFRRTCRHSARCWPPTWRPRSTRVWDAAPGPADRIAVVGAGVVGSLVAYLCGRIPGTDVTLVDINPAARNWPERSGLAFAKPGNAKGDCDLVVHASGTPDGLRTALELAGDEATVLEMSWYGDAASDRAARRRRSTAAGCG